MKKQETLKEMVRRVIKEESSNDKILNLVKKLRQIDDTFGAYSKQSKPIVKTLQKLKVMDSDGNFIYGHPLMDEIDQIMS